MAANKKNDPTTHEKPYQMRKKYCEPEGLISWADRYFDALNKNQ